MKPSESEPAIEKEGIEWIKWYMKTNKCGLHEAANERFIRMKENNEKL